MTKVSVAPDRPMLTTPVVLLSCWGVEREKPNIITLAWSGIVCSGPPMVYASIRPSRHSHGLLKANGDFVLNLPTAEQVRMVDTCGVVSGADRDKFQLCGLTAQPAEKVDAPLIAQCPINLECRIRQVLELGLHNAFLAEVLAIWADEDILAGEGVVNAEAFAPLVYSAGSRVYHRAVPIEGTRYGYSAGK